MNTIKSIIISLLTFNVPCLLAGTMATLNYSPSQNQLYIGGDIGVANFLDKEKHTVNPESHQLGSMGILGGGFIGYDRVFTPKLRGAVEIFGDATGFNLEISHPPHALNINQRYMIGVRVLPEYVFTPQTTSHIILGYVNGKFNINDDGTYGLINTGYHQNGFQTGAGFTQMLNDHFFIRLNGIYNIFAQQNSLGTTSSALNQTYSETFSSFIGEISLIYQLM